MHVQQLKNQPDEDSSSDDDILLAQPTAARAAGVAPDSPPAAAADSLCGSNSDSDAAPAGGSVAQQIGSRAGEAAARSSAAGVVAGDAGTASVAANPASTSSAQQNGSTAGEAAGGGGGAVAAAVPAPAGAAVAAASPLPADAPESDVIIRSFGQALARHAAAIGAPPAKIEMCREAIVQPYPERQDGNPVPEGAASKAAALLTPVCQSSWLARKVRFCPVCRMAASPLSPEASRARVCGGVNVCYSTFCRAASEGGEVVCRARAPSRCGGDPLQGKLAAGGGTV